MISEAEQLENHWKNTHEYKSAGYENFKDDRREYLANLILSKKPKKILEIGTFGGYNLRKIHSIDQKIELFGFDINKEALKYAKTHCEAINTIHGSIYEINKYFNNNSFDLVFTAGVLIHIPNKNIQSIIKNLINISNNNIIHAEHHGNFQKLKMTGMRWKHDFLDLYKEHTIKIENAPNASHGFEHIIDVTLIKE